MYYSMLSRSPRYAQYTIFEWNNIILVLLWVNSKVPQSWVVLFRSLLIILLHRYRTIINWKLVIRPHELIIIITITAKRRANKSTILINIFRPWLKCVSQQSHVRRNIRRLGAEKSRFVKFDVDDSTRAHMVITTTWVDG